MIDAHPAPTPLAWHLVVRGQLRVRSGRLDDGESDLRAALEVRPPVEPEIRARALGLLAEAALVRGDPSGAIVLVDEALAVLAPTDEVPVRTHLHAVGLRAAADRAQRAGARREDAGVADAAAIAGSHVTNLLLAQAGSLVDGGGTEARVTSRVAWGLAEEGRRAGASDPASWAAAATALSAAGEPHLAFGCRYREAEAMLAARSDRSAATAILREISTWAAAVGAMPLLREVESLARRARLDLDDPSGVPGTPRTGQPAPGPGDPYGLSSRELEVLALLVAGRTNREIGETLFISDKTASAHVTHILDKLGVKSRGAAAALAARGGLVATGPDEQDEPSRGAH